MEQKEIEKVISEYFSIDIKDIYSKSRKKNVILAKHLLIFILHDKENVSYSKLSIQFKVCTRNIQYIVYKMRSYVQYDKEIKRYFTHISKMLS
jgi:chromosomal replication initiation ATPase DnaA